jgi:hypothetical protein
MGSILEHSKIKRKTKKNMSPCGISGKIGSREKAKVAGI